MLSAENSEAHNGHSGLCLIVTGRSPGVWLSGCTPGVSVAEWKIAAYPRGVPGGYKITTSTQNDA